MSVKGQLSSGEGTNARPNPKEGLTWQDFSPLQIISHVITWAPFSSSHSLLDTLHLPITAQASYCLKKSSLRSYQKPSMMSGSLDRKEIPAVALPTMHRGYP